MIVIKKKCGEIEEHQSLLHSIKKVLVMYLNFIFKNYSIFKKKKSNTYYMCVLKFCLDFLYLYVRFPN